MRYVLFGFLIALVAGQAVFIAWLIREHARERARLYSIAFAKSSNPAEVAQATALIKNEPLRVPPMPSVQDPFAEYEQVGGSYA